MKNRRFSKIYRATAAVLVMMMVFTMMFTLAACGSKEAEAPAEDGSPPAQTKAQCALPSPESRRRASKEARSGYAHAAALSKEYETSDFPVFSEDSSQMPILTAAVRPQTTTC